MDKSLRFSVPPPPPTRAQVHLGFTQCGMVGNVTSFDFALFHSLLRSKGTDIWIEEWRSGMSNSLSFLSLHSPRTAVAQGHCQELNFEARAFVFVSRRSRISIPGVNSCSFERERQSSPFTGDDGYGSANSHFQCSLSNLSFPRRSDERGGTARRRGTGYDHQIP